MIDLVRRVLFKFRGPLFPWIPWEITYPADRGNPPVADEGSLQKAYNESELAQEPDTFVLYRIIGNDLEPRHRKGQSRENLQFILKHEPELAQCEKRWVVNRIVDTDEEQAIIDLLQAHKQRYIHIPFDLDAYSQVPWDFDGTLYPGFSQSLPFRILRKEMQTRYRIRYYRHKNNYAINNNGARNAALREGRGQAKWVLPWDGNCFVTAQAWDEIVRKVTAEPWYPYFIVPMARLTDNSRLFDPHFRPTPLDEPQILFRRDAQQEFDEAYPYGRRPKVELFWRLGIPGNWDQWGIEPWDLPCPDYAEDAGCFSTAGWVARLFSGQAHMETNDNYGDRHRRLAREDAIIAFLDQLDETAGANITS